MYEQVQKIQEHYSSACIMYYLCGSYTFSSLSEELTELSRDNPDNEMLFEIQNLSEPAAPIMSCILLLFAEHLFDDDYKDLCK